MTASHAAATPSEASRPGARLLALDALRIIADVPQSVADQVRNVRRAVVYVDGRRIELEATGPSGSGATTFELGAESPYLGVLILS